MTRGLGVKTDLTFFWNLVLRQVRQDYLENITGFAWLVLQPLLLLAVYAFVFTTIFQARVIDAPGIGFVPYLAVAFWPWMAFSDAILRATNAITSNAALIGKVAFASEQLPLAAVTATFLMNLAGYVAVLVILQLTGTDIHWPFVPILLVLLALMWMLASAIALFTSAIQVFVRDVSQILPPLMTFWFFTTPILYSLSALPPRAGAVLAWNPMGWFVSNIRGWLLFGEAGLTWLDGLAAALVVLALWLGLKFFRRFSGHFEDFL